MTSQGLIERFDLSVDNLNHPIPWEGNVGFSIFEDSKDGFASLYKIGLSQNTEINNLKKLWVTATYGKKTDSGISIGTSKNISDPIDLEANNEFFFDINSDKFFHHKNEIDPKNILIKLKNAHLRPTRLIKGLPLRVKLVLWRRFLPSIVKVLDKILVFLLYCFTGEVVEDKDLVKRFVNDWYEPINKKPRESIFDEADLGRKIKTPKIWNFLGFTATRWSVVFYSLVHLIVYLIKPTFWQNNSSIVFRIFENNFLTLCYVATSFSIIEFLIPKILRNSIRRIPKLYQRISYIKLRVFI